MKRPSPPALLLRKILQRLGLHPDDHDSLKVDLTAGVPWLSPPTTLRLTSASPLGYSQAS